MTAQRRRIIDPGMYTDPRMSSIEMTHAYPGFFTLAEDSGCLVWDARQIRAALFGLFETTVDGVQELMALFEETGLVRVYEADGRRFAWLTEWPVWQQGLTWIAGPSLVPLPEWISYTPYRDKKRRTSGVYTFPDGHTLPRGARAELTEPNGTEPTEVNEPVRSLSTDCSQATDGREIGFEDLG